MGEIIVIGSINMDLVVRTKRIPAAGETIPGQEFRLIPGGKGANQAVAASKLGGNVSMVGCVGKRCVWTKLVRVSCGPGCKYRICVYKEFFVDRNGYDHCGRLGGKSDHCCGRCEWGSG